MKNQYAKLFTLGKLVLGALIIVSVVIKLMIPVANATTRDDVYHAGLFVTKHMYGESNPAISKFLANVAVVQSGAFSSKYMDESAQQDKHGLFAMTTDQFLGAMNIASDEALDFINSDILLIDNMKDTEAAVAMALVYIQAAAGINWSHDILSIDKQAEVWTNVFDDGDLGPDEYKICIEMYEETL